jgi:hypothetical protein
VSGVLEGEDPFGLSFTVVFEAPYSASRCFRKDDCRSPRSLWASRLLKGRGLWIDLNPNLDASVGDGRSISRV